MLNFINKKFPYLLVTPAILLLTVFAIIPIIVALFISLTNAGITGLADFSKIEFVGLDNFQAIFSDPVFYQSIGNTLTYVMIGVPLLIVLSMGLAIIINFGQNRFFQAFKLIFYAPSVTGLVAVAVIWSFLYNPFGFFNYLLGLLHLGPINWLQDPKIAKFSLIILALWRGIGTNMIIFLAALQGIPKDYYEAAALDGASLWEQIIHITIPSLKFATFFVGITSLIGWLQFFDEPLIMTKGGPLNSTMSISLFIYKNGFQLSNFGYAAAGSFVLFAAIVVVTLLMFRFQGKEK